MVPTYKVIKTKYLAGRTFKKGYTINELRVLKLLKLKDFSNPYEAIDWLYENVVPQDVSILKLINRRKLQYIITHLIDRLALRLINLDNFNNPYEAISYLHENTMPEDLKVLRQFNKENLVIIISELMEAQLYVR